MRIDVEPGLMLRLMSLAAATHLEFSGFGFCRLEGDVIFVYDFVLLNLGSAAYTEIPAPELLKLMERPDYKNMKAWAHVHPMGGGIPGPANWSARDEQTIRETPLGGVPELVKWSVSLVLTPGGWVGRIDNHLTGKTVHLEVTPSVQPYYAEIAALAEKKYRDAFVKAETEEKRKKARVGQTVAVVKRRIAALDQNLLADLGIETLALEEMALAQFGITGNDIDGYALEDDLRWDEALEEGLAAEDYDAYLFGEEEYRHPARDRQQTQRRLQNNHEPRETH